MGAAFFVCVHPREASPIRGIAAFCTPLSQFGSPARVHAPSTNCSIMQRVLLTNAITTHGARCLDGSAAAYYVRLGSSSSFIMYMQGGGNCAGRTVEETIRLCASRRMSRMGSTDGYPATTLNSDDTALSGLFDATGNKGSIMSPDKVINPLFSNWTAVWLAYCDGSAFGGDAEEPVSASDGSSIWFRGRRNLHAIIDDLKVRYGMASAAEVLLVGSSSGGMAALQQADFVGSLLPATTRYGAIEDGGWYLPSSTFNHNQWDLRMRSLHTVAQTRSNVACEAAFPASEEWHCMIATTVFPYITSRMFLAEAAYDAWQLVNHLGVTCSNYGSDLSACTVADMAEIDLYGGIMRSSIRAALNSSAHHATESSTFMSACIIHAHVSWVMMGDEGWTLRAGGSTLRDEVHAWWLGRVHNPPVIEPCEAFPCNPRCLKFNVLEGAPPMPTLPPTSPVPPYPPPSPPAPPSSPPPSEPPTIALLERLSASTSSVYSDTEYQPSLCIDGMITNQGDNINICLSALHQPDAWLSVTLPERSVVGEVVVYGRSDCCNIRFLSGFEVWVSDAIGLPTAGAYKCGGPFEVVEDRASVDVVSCSRRQGRVVTLLLPGASRTVMISELEVRGYQAVVSPPAPPPELPSQLEPTPPFTPPEPPSQYPPASASLPPSTPAAPSQPSWCASVETPTTSCSVAPEQVSERCTCRYTWIRGCSGPVDVRLRCFE